jgi:hypothetical protein
MQLEMADDGDGDDDQPQGNTSSGSADFMGIGVQSPPDAGIAGCLTGESLMDCVLNWSIAEFYNANLLERTLHLIPQKFDSPLEWFSSFDKFVVEELRCDLQRSVACEVEGEGMGEGLPRIGLVTLTGHPLDFWEGRRILRYLTFAVKSPDDSKELGGVACTFALFVKNCPSQRLSMKKLNSLPHFLGHIGFPPKRQKRNAEVSDTFEMSYLNSPASKDFSESAHLSQEWTALLLGVGSTTAVRLCDALSRGEASPFMGDILTAQAVYCSHLPVDTRPLTRYAVEDIESASVGDDDDDFFRASSFVASLNESQKEAVYSVLRVGNAGISSIQIIKGPPGTYLSCQEQDASYMYLI